MSLVADHCGKGGPWLQCALESGVCHLQESVRICAVLVVHVIFVK